MLFHIFFLALKATLSIAIDISLHNLFVLNMVIQNLNTIFVHYCSVFTIFAQAFFLEISIDYIATIIFSILIYKSLKLCNRTFQSLEILETSILLSLFLGNNVFALSCFTQFANLTLAYIGGPQRPPIQCKWQLLLNACVY